MGEFPPVVACRSSGNNSSMGNSQGSSDDSQKCESSGNSNCPTFSYKGRDYCYIGDHKQELEDFKCAICLGVIVEPVQTSCGHLFCAQCINGIHNECPTCRHNNFTTTQDGFVARKIGGISVTCPNGNQGCYWMGTLRECVDHLGNVCKYEEVQCEYCEHRGHRREVNCLHPTWCASFPLRCPNRPGCGAVTTRATLEGHLRECPEQLLACKFAPAGCTAIVSRRNFKKHLRVEAERHGQLCIERIEQLSTLVLTSQLNAAGNHSSEIDGGICYRPWLCNPCLKKQPTPPYLLTINLQGTFINGSFEARSDPFYSHAGGYKLQLHVVVSSDDCGNCVKVSVHLLVGENDHELMFPFKGTVTVSLMNEHVDREHQEMTIQLNPQLCRREDRGTLQDSGSSFRMLPNCWWLENSSSAPSCIVDGRLYIKVLSVDFDREYMSTCVPV